MANIFTSNEALLFNKKAPNAPMKKKKEDESNYVYETPEHSTLNPDAKVLNLPNPVNLDEEFYKRTAKNEINSAYEASLEFQLAVLHQACKQRTEHILRMLDIFQELDKISVKRMKKGKDKECQYDMLSGHIDCYNKMMGNYSSIYEYMEKEIKADNFHF